MKDEIDISECKTLIEVKSYMNNYIFEYNNERPQWDKKKMTPVQYRNHLIGLRS
jgi:putative transposase